MGQPPPPPSHQIAASVGMSGLSAAGPSGVSSAATASMGHSRFGAAELAIVLSYYDIGVIETIQEFPRGSRKAPKLLIRSDRGLYLLKRRARGRDDPFKVAFSHQLQLYLSSKQFPLPHLIGTKNENNSILQWRNGIYELFEYIKGGSYDNSLDATADSGKTLAMFHKLLANFEPEYEPAAGSYHASRSVGASFGRIVPTLSASETDARDESRQQIEDLVHFIQTAYNEAALRVNELGLPDWPMQIVHSDWHPGNMLFRGSHVVAVIDYDSARVQQRITDIANGALQFSIIGGGDDPARWPDNLDESRFKRFLRAYDSVPNCVLSRAELRTIAPLMIEALIAESVIPIAQTGSFARMDGLDFLRMVERKVRWMQKHDKQMTELLDV